jgi:dipeptidyl aminopeptidase/acylaminoacyl peptidase
MEAPVVFKSHGEQVVGMLHVPARRKGKCPAVVFFHGFTGTKVEAHRLFVKMARALAKVGMVVLRFDFRGCGDSAGEFSQMTISREIEDARAALKFLRARPEVEKNRIGILGLSMGGLVAAMMLGERPEIRAAALWAAVADLKLQIKRKETPLARKQLREMGCVDYGGLAVGQAFFKDTAHNPLKSIARTNARVLIVHGSEDETVPPKAADDYERALKKAKRVVFKHIVAGANHTFSSLPWETEVLHVTLEWFRNLL